MRIAIDARELAGHATGVGRYLGEILREWSRLPAAAGHEFIFCAPDDPSRHPAVAALPGEAAVGAGGGTLWEQRVLPSLARKARADVLFCPGYSGPMFDSTPLVVAIHDVSFAAHPEWFRWREGLRRRVVTRQSARRAARILTISEFSRREIVDRLGVSPAKVTVVYPGVSRVTGATAGPEARQEPLVLYVGSVFNRRHVPETIRGFRRLARRYPTARLTIVGDNRTFPRVPLEAVADGSDAVQLLSWVNDDELGMLYRTARAFVFLSEYEGFGLTPLEALATGIPVVLLDTPVAREVCGEAAIYVRAPDARLVEAALETALFDQRERARVLAAAPAVLARYSWSACAAGVLDALAGAAAR